MANVGQVYGGKYLTAEDIDVAPVRCQIMSAGVDPKLGRVTLEIDKFDKLLVCNKTNALVIAEVLGDETDTWPDNYVSIRRGKTMYQGKRTDCITVSSVERKQSGSPEQKPAGHIPQTQHG